MAHCLPQRGRLLMLAVLLISLAFSLPAQSGFSYYSPSGFRFVGHAGGFDPLRKIDANSVVDVNGNIARLHGYIGMTSGKDCILQVSDVGGTELYTRVIDINAFRLQPMAIVDAVGDGHVVLVYDRIQDMSFVLFFDYSGNNIWTREIPDCMAKDVCWINSGASGAPEVVVVGHHASNRTLISQLEVSSGNPSVEYLQPGPGGSPIIGYAIESPNAFSNGVYKVVATDGGQTFFVSTFFNNGTYWYTIQNEVLGAGVVSPYSIVEDNIGSLVVSGTVDGPNGQDAFLAYLNDHGEMQWNRHNPLGNISSYEYAISNPVNGDLMAVGYHINGNGQLESMGSAYDIMGNLLNHVRYYPYSTGTSDDFMSGISLHPGGTGYISTGVARDGSTSLPSLASRMDLDFAGNTYCQDPVNIPNVDYGTAWTQILMPPTNAVVTDPSGNNLLTSPHKMVDCFFRKTSSAEQTAVTLQAAELKVFPQPATNLLNVEVIEDQFEEIRLIALDGRVLFSRQFTGEIQTSALDVASVAAGVYFLEVKAADHMWTRKVLLQ